MQSAWNYHAYYARLVDSCVFVLLTKYAMLFISSSYYYFFQEPIWSIVIKLRFVLLLNSGPLLNYFSVLGT